MSDADQVPPAPALTRASEVADWLAPLREGRLAVDIEGDGMFRYRARLCTVQLADVERTCVVDTLAVDARAALGSVLANDRIEKVVHDASFDARMLRDAGAPLTGLFDTALAARLLGYPATGLAAMLDRHFGVVLDKEPQQADWGKRPLDEQALGYLHADVRHLLPLAEVLERALREADVWDEFRVECDYVLQQAAADTGGDSRPLWARVKGGAALRAPARAVLRELATLRESFAEERDLPPGRLLPAGLLLELANRRPQSTAQVDKLLRRTRLDAAARRAVQEAIARGLAAKDVPEDELLRAQPPAPEPALRALHKRRRAGLIAFRAAEAERRAVDPQVVLPGHCVKDLTGLNEVTPDTIAATPGLGECRRTRYGAAILEALRGAEQEPE